MQDESPLISARVCSRSRTEGPWIEVLGFRSVAWFSGHAQTVSCYYYHALQGLFQLLMPNFHEDEASR